MSIVSFLRRMNLQLFRSLITLILHVSRKRLFQLSYQNCHVSFLQLKLLGCTQTTFLLQQICQRSCTCDSAYGSVKNQTQLLLHWKHVMLKSFQMLYSFDHHGYSAGYFLRDRTHFQSAASAKDIHKILARLRQPHGSGTDKNALRHCRVTGHRRTRW